MQIRAKTVHEGVCLGEKNIKQNYTFIMNFLGLFDSNNDVNTTSHPKISYSATHIGYFEILNDILPV